MKDSTVSAKVRCGNEDFMVSNSTLTAVSMTVIISLFLPIMAFMLYGMRNKKKGVWTAWLLGGAIFCVIQFLFKSPILSMFAIGCAGLVENFYIIYCLVLAALAGLFGAIARYVIARIMSKKGLTFKRSIAAGMGYGGVEAILTVAVPNIVNLVFLQMIMVGAFDEVIKAATEQASADGLIQMRDMLVNTGTTQFYLVGYESVLNMILHVALVLFMCHMMWRKKDAMAFWVSMAISSVIDFVTMILDGMATPYLGSIISEHAAFVTKYAILTIVAIVFLLYIFLIRSTWKQEEQ